MGAIPIGDRLFQLRTMLAASTLNSEPKPGFRLRVSKLRAEIARLEQEAGHGQAQPV